jgi:predicted HicB family RNase H-like nuclease
MKRYDNQVCLKLACPLRAALEAEAAARGRSLSNLIRKILIDHAAQSAVDRNQIAA